MLLEMAAYQGLVEFHEGYDDSEKCKTIPFNSNVLLTVPLYVYECNVFYQFLFVQRNSKLDFRRKVSLYLVCLYLLGTLKVFIRYTSKRHMRPINHHSDDDDSALYVVLGYIGIPTIMGIVMFLSFTQYKLA